MYTDRFKYSSNNTRMDESFEITHFTATYFPELKAHTT